MKKMMVSLMLILSMFAFAAESAPSATVGYVKYTNVLNATLTDLNQVAIPVTNSWTLSSHIDPTSLYYNAVSKWNPVTQAYSTSSRVGTIWTNTFAIAPGNALVLNAKANNDLIVNGTVNTIPAYNLVLNATTTDLNHIMLPLTKATLTTAALLGANIGVCNTISKWNNLTQAYQASSKVGTIWTNSYAIEIAQPLMINMTGNLTWPTAKDGEVVENYADAVVPKAGLPRTVYVGVADAVGTPYDFSAAPYGNITFRCLIEARPLDVLHEGTLSTMYETFGMGVSAVSANISDFAGVWATGEVLNIKIKDEVNLLEETWTFTLDNSTDPILAGLDDWLGAGVSTTTPASPILINSPSSIESEMVPVETRLHQNYPNPFNPTTTIKFDLAANSNVKLNVYNYNGQLVKSLVNGTMNAGFHAVNFDASSLSAGVYYYTMEAAGRSMTQKMVLVK